MRIQIDPAADTFLLDHVVDGSPVLPTVMQLDLVARALQAAGWEQPAGLMLRDIRVGPPVRFDRPGPRDLDLLCTAEPACGTGRAAWRYELCSPGHAAPHLMVVAEPAIGPPPRRRPPAGWTDGLPGRPDLVYPPLFHGPAFQVVAAFGRAGSSVRAALEPSLPPLSWGSGPTALRPRLLELLLQCCGLCELAETGRMMVPASLDAVHWHPGSLAAAAGSRALAVVRPRPRRRTGRRSQEPGRVFDGHVVTPAGTVLVTVTGYHSRDLGRAADLAHAARLTRCLARHPDPAPCSRPEPAIPEGASR